MSFENFDVISTLYKKRDRRKLISTCQMFKKRDQYSAVKTKQALYIKYILYVQRQYSGFVLFRPLQIP